MLTWWRASPGETVVFDKVMLVGDKDNTTGTVLCVPHPGSSVPRSRALTCGFHGSGTAIHQRSLCDGCH